MGCGVSAWIDREVGGGQFPDERLGRRLRTLLDQMAGAMGESIPLAC
jgi:Transposase DNA-binding